ncbi:MAG TPA: hydrogenase expression/formation C-terminal domain-containing protein [Patescibacteria group bacterium]|nr:hydrogenase expression/formation C-terminal domain-containing protein [Patescibacteria group bacterium]
MNETWENMSTQTVAVLHEISTALTALAETGATHTLFIDKMGLAPEDRQNIRGILGEGGLRIRLEGSDEPAEWLESGTAGVWYGVFFNQNGQPILETLEVAMFPALAATQRADLLQGAERLRRRLTVG